LLRDVDVDDDDDDDDDDDMMMVVVMEVHPLLHSLLRAGRRSTLS
jgi:hypothetical protein